MKSLLLTSIFIIVSICLFAQLDQEKGKELISKSISKYKGYDDFKVDFDLVIEDKMTKEKINQKGVFWLKGGKYKIEMDEQTIATDLDKIWVHLKTIPEVQVSNYIAEEQEINPALFFNSLDNGYLYAFVGNFKVYDKVCFLVEMVPEDKEMSFYKIKAYINQKTNLLQRIKVYNTGGSILTFDLSNHKLNNKLKDDFFSFSRAKFQGIDIIDLTE